MSIASFFSKEGGLKNILALDKVIQKLIYLLVFLLPLWFLPITVNAVEFNKQILMVLLVVFTLILWLVKILNQGEIQWKSSIINIALGVFIVVYALATIFSLRPYNSLVGWSTHLSGSLINILSFVALYVLIVNNIKGLKDVFKLLLVFLASSGLVGLIGFIQMWGGFMFPWEFTKVVSFNTVGTVNSFGIFAAAVLVLVTALLFVVKRVELKVCLLLLALLNFLILISLNFWVLWLVLIAGIIIVLVFGLIKMVNLGEGITWTAIPMIFLAVALIFLFFRPVLPVRPNLPTEVGLSYKGGLEIIKQVVKDKPILGTGPENFVINYAKYKPSVINQTLFWNVRFANPPSEIYSIISDLGILGLVSFLAVIILFLVSAIKNLIKTTETGDNLLKKFLEVGLFGAWFALLVGLVIYPQSLTLMFVFWFLFAVFLAESSILKEKVFNLRKSQGVLLLASFSFVIIIIVMVGFVYIQGTRFVAELNYKRGLDLVQRDGKIEDGINKLIKATVINPYEDRIYSVLSQLFILKLNQDVNREDINQQQQANLIQVDAINAINSSVRATTLAPKDASNWLIRGQVYRQVIGLVNGADQWANDSFEESVKLEPLNPFALTEWGRLYIDKATMLVQQAQKDKEAKATMNQYLETALEKFNKAIEAKADYAPAHFESAVVFERQGKLNEAIAKMEINRQLLPRDTGIAFQLGVLYYRAQKYTQAKGEFIRAIVLDDNFANARYFLGLLYDREGDKESAIDQFDRIAQLNPDNEEIKQILANLKAGLPALGSEELGPPKQPAEIPIEQQPEEQ
ncbi:MAG: tetratricopeptide repeat protein [bacterium]|nr:tetratricopeptide repeat protein [bacterium]